MAEKNALKTLGVGGKRAWEGMAGEKAWKVSVRKWAAEKKA